MGLTAHHKAASGQLAALLFDASILRRHNRVKQVLKAPKSVHHPGQHCGRQPLATVDRVPRPPDEVVEREENRTGRLQVFKLLAEPQRQAGEPLQEGSDRQVVPLDVRRAYRVDFTLAYLTELTSVRDELKAGLSATAHVQGDAAKPTVSELAEKIKTLKAAHSFEATPQRARQKHSSAEEPITARIRRRTEAVLAIDPVIEPDAAALPKTAPPLESPQNSSNQPQMTFQERIAMERRRTEREPSLP